MMKERRTNIKKRKPAESIEQLMNPSESELELTYYEAKGNYREAVRMLLNRRKSVVRSDISNSGVAGILMYNMLHGNTKYLTSKWEKDMNTFVDNSISESGVWDFCDTGNTMIVV